jgi:hypothetical protein
MFITAFTRARRIRDSCIRFVIWLSFYGEELLPPRPTLNLEDHLVSAVRECLFNIFAATLHICRPFLQPQPEDAPCRGDRNPLITELVTVWWVNTDQLNAFYITGPRTKSITENAWLLQPEQRGERTELRVGFNALHSSPPPDMSSLYTHGSVLAQSKQFSYQHTIAFPHLVTPFLTPRTSSNMISALIKAIHY